MSTNMNGPEGMIFAGKYKIIKQIGKGGMANVYLAVDTNSGINVAIKILKSEFSTDEEFIRRFDTEAKAVSSLNHSNIVKVYGVGHEGNYRYIVQEYVDGITVKELINQNGHLDWKVAVPIVIQVGMALEYAHQNGVVHRDIKPQNILISRDKIAKITDFGIARASSNTTITMTSGGAMGSVHYFSPEQARGSNVGPASDIYSVGAMLFEMVTGRVPFDGDSNVAIAVKHLQEKVPMASTYVPDIPQGLDSIINKCMQKTPERRYTSMRQMVTELDSLLIDPNGVYGVIDTTISEEESNISFRQDPNYDKISDIERSAEQRRISRVRDNMLLALIVVLIIGALIGISVLVIKSVSNATNISQSSDYTVKNFVGEDIVIVEEELKKNRVNYTIKYSEAEGVKPGLVISQSIAEGIVISEKSTVSELQLIVSKSADSFELSNYTGLKYSDAYSALTALNLQPSIRSEINEKVAAGIVIRTEPEAGSVVKVGDPIVIIYASEPTSAKIPDVIGLTLKDAKKQLTDAKLVVGQIEGAPEVLKLDEKKQYVMAVDPAVGTEVPKSSSIKIIVGSAADVKNGGTPTPTPPMTEITASVEGSGTVTGGGVYAPGTQLTLKAEPAQGYKFSYWKDSLGNILVYSNTYTFIVSEKPGMFIAVFEPLPTATPTPAPTATPTPKPTATPKPTPTPKPTTAPTEPDPGPDDPVDPVED